jgi:hypothetical protein
MAADFRLSRQLEVECITTGIENRIQAQPGKQE